MRMQKFRFMSPGTMMDRVKCATRACALKRKVLIAQQPERNLGSDHVVLALMPPRNDLAVSEMVCVFVFFSILQ